jgi:hypothetical protein
MGRSETNPGLLTEAMAGMGLLNSIEAHSFIDPAQFDLPRERNSSSYDWKVNFPYECASMLFAFRSR